MESFDDSVSEYEQRRKFAVIEESINRTLLADDFKERQTYCFKPVICFIIPVLVILIIVIILLLVNNISC